MIVDQAKVIFRSGAGGKASPAFTNLSSGNRVGTGGEGGRGGDVILKVNPRLYDLRTFKGSKAFVAASGAPGAKNNKKGKSASDLIIGVPAGTRIIEQGKIIADLLAQAEQFLICRGGAGGLGTFRRGYVVPPKVGQEKEVVLDYRVPNQVAILGFPNSGKTSLFNALTQQKHKVADYPFTTTACAWAPCASKFGSFVVLDTPPLTRVEKPSQQEKNYFLRQILRSKIIIFLGSDLAVCQKDFADILNEVKSYDAALLEGKIFFYLARSKTACWVNPVRNNNPQQHRISNGVYLLAKIDTIDRKVNPVRNSFSNGVKVKGWKAGQEWNIPKLREKIAKVLG